MRSRPALVRAALLVTGLAGLGAPAARTQTLGLYFDAAGTSCTAAISSFGTLQVYLVARLDTGDELVGAIFRIRMPSGIVITEDSVQFPRNVGGVMDGTVTSGMNLQLFPCQPTDEPVVLLQFEIWESSLQPRTDLVLELEGFAEDSLTSSNMPQIKICDPQDPGGHTSLVPTPKARANLNCTADCPCIVGVERRRWGGIKSLYRER
jgi:hypothetical protein